VSIILKDLAKLVGMNVLVMVLLLLFLKPKVNLAPQLGVMG